LTSSAGTRLAPEELFKRNCAWAAVIARNVARKLPDNFDPGDLLQEALIEMWKRAQLYKPANGRPGRDPSGTPFQAYAYLAVRGACLMSVRRKAWLEAKHASLSDASTGGSEVAERRGGSKNLLASQHGGELTYTRKLREPASKAKDPEQVLLGKAIRKKERDRDSYQTRWIWKQVAKMPEADAELMRLVYIDKLDTEQIAGQMGVERAVIARRLAAIVKRLKKVRA
jgi:RNA polymerase sigma factor (sigma-70 family)